MPKRSTLLFLIVILIFVLALAITFPVGKGLLGNKGLRLGLDLQGGTHVVYQADMSKVQPGSEKAAIEGAIAVLENRVNPLGVTEPLIQSQGGDRIVVELPGVSLTDQEKAGLSRVAVLEFGELATENETFKWENSRGKWKPATGLLNGQETELTSQYFNENTFVDLDNLGNIHLRFSWNADGAILSKEITTRLIGQPLGIFEGSDSLVGEDGRPIAPTVQTTIESNGEITGLTRGDATRLSRQLNAGRLPVPLIKIYDETVSPILGANFVTLSVRAGIVALLVIMLFMIIYYRISGVVACLALIYYGVLLLAVFKLLNATMTLSAIGGFVLTLGMAVDANVLIFERMKEELWGGRGLGAAIDAGFHRAWPAIFDSNATTILAGLILLWLSSSIVASGPVRGFAVTLIIGVLASMFTAVAVTRMLLRPFINSSLAQRTSLFAPHQRKANG
ncbi:MAG: protein translocase subunit SecD [Chloroflexota bacterium]